jgi:hypothetical protein
MYNHSFVVDLPSLSFSPHLKLLTLLFSSNQVPFLENEQPLSYLFHIKDPNFIGQVPPTASRNSCKWKLGS